MNSPDLSRITEALGWVLLHFLWQGAVVAALLWLVLRQANHRRPQVRYAAAGFAMLLMLAAASVTLWREFSSLPPVPRPASPPEAVSAPPPVESHSQRALGAQLPPTSPLERLEAPAAKMRISRSEALPPPREELAASRWNRLVTALRPCMPWMVGAWALGVLAFSLRLLSGWCILRKWRRSGTAPEDIWNSRFVRLCQRMGLRQAVKLLSSTTVAVPMVVGWLKPVILIPTSLFAGLTPSQLEAILAHELAHIRRHDFLINLLQTIVETLLFYHPAVWWVSAQLRKEREHCCDDVASSLCGGALDYARALTALEEIRGPSEYPAGAAISAAGGSLLARIRRLIGMPEEKSTAWPLSFLALTLIVVLTSLTILNAAQDDDAATQAEKPAVTKKEAGTSKSPPPSYHDMDKSLLNRWQILEERETPISEKSLAGLREAIRRCLADPKAAGAAFTAEQSKALESFLSWNTGRNEHPAGEVSVMLSDLLAVHGAPIQLAFNETPTPGRPFNGEEDAKAMLFGPAGAHGLRAAWTMGPRKSTYVFGDELSGYLTLWNTGDETIVIGNGTDQAGLRPAIVFTALGENGRRIEVVVETKDTVNFIAKRRLKSGEAATMGGYFVKIGEGAAREDSFRPKYATDVSILDLRGGEDIALSAAVDFPKAPGDPGNYARLQTGELKFKTVAPEDIKAWATNRAGIWPMAGGVQLHIYGELVHAADVSTTAILTWPAQGNIPAHHWFTWVAGDAFANREAWAVAWETDKPVLWIAARSINGTKTSADGKPVADRLKRVDFSNPNHITEQAFTGWPKENPPSPEVLSQLASLMEVPAVGDAAGVIHSWASEGSPERIDLAAVQNISISVEKDGSLKVHLDTEKACGVDRLAETLNGLISEWSTKRVAYLAGRQVTKRATISAPSAYNADAVAKIMQACAEAGCGPALVANAPPDLDANLSSSIVKPTTDGTYTAQVLQSPDRQEVVLLTKRPFTASPDATSHSGSITLPVNTSDKTETIVYTWAEATPGVLDLKAGGYPISRFDLSRGRVFLVHFDKLEFSAQIFQVPAELNIPAISSPESLTQAAAAVSAWQASCDDRALWELTRVIVPEEEIKAGQPLDAAAEKIAWGEPSEVGLRLGLGGLAPDLAVPVGQPLPLEQYVRNDGSRTIAFSPTQIFNEGVDGALIRTSDGKVIPHQKGYRWQMPFDRVRLAPAHYIKLGSGPMRTIMAEKDGSSTGAMGMMGHGFTVLPGEYTLQITHGIGQFLGRPVNSEFGDPRNAPGLGEWTGILKSASVPLRLVDQEIKTAKPGSNEAFGSGYKIDFEKGVLKLRHYNGYPNMSLIGQPWESESRDWKTKAADGDYLVAWAVGGKGLWVKDAEGISHLIVKANLTENGHWPLDQAAGDLGSMPAGVRAALQLPPQPVSKAFDFTKLPKTAGPARFGGKFFEMSIPTNAAGQAPQLVLKVPYGKSEFYLESEGSSYGPAKGNPVVELGMTDLLRQKLAETPNTSGLALLEKMITQGRGSIRDCAFRLLGELKAPQTPFDYDALFHAIIHARIQDDEGPKELSAEAHTAGTYFWNLFHESRREWERTRPLLPDDRYQPGDDLTDTPGIIWSPGPDGLSIGVSGPGAGSKLEIGKSMPVAVYLRNDGPAAVKLSVPTGHNPVLQISLTDGADKETKASYRFGTGVTGYQHRNLAPGTGVRVAAVDLEAYATAAEVESSEHKEGKEHNPRLSVPVGNYALHLEYRNYPDEPVARDPVSEWTGKLVAQAIDLNVAAPAETSAAPVPNVRGLSLAGFPTDLGRER